VTSERLNRCLASLFRLQPKTARAALQFFTGCARRLTLGQAVAGEGIDIAGEGIDVTEHVAEAIVEARPDAPLRESAAAVQTLWQATILPGATVRREGSLVSHCDVARAQRLA